MLRLCGWRGVVTYALAAAAVLSLACGSALAQKRISMWSLAGSGYQEVQDELARRYMELHPEVSIEIEYLLYTEIRDKIVVALAAGLAPDIIMLPTRDAPSFIDQGLVVPVDPEAFELSSKEEIADLFIPGVANALQHDGEFYFMPTEFTSLALYYNRDLLLQRGLSEDALSTWQDIKEQGRKLTDFTGDIPQQVGISFLRWQTYNVFWYLSFIRSAGEDWLVDGQPAFSRPASVRAIEEYVSFYREGIASPIVGPDQFPLGRVGFVPGITGAIYDYRTMNLGFDLGVAPFPYLEWGEPVNIAYAWGYYVTSEASDAKQAWDIVNFFTSEEHAPFWYAKAKLFIPRGQSWIFDIVGDDPDLQVLLLQTAGASTMELAHKNYAEIEQAIVSSQAEIIDQGVSVRESLIRLDEKLAAIVQR